MVPEVLPAFRRAAAAVGLAAAALVAVLAPAPARAQDRDQAVLLLDRLCAQTLRTNEEDRLFGVISTAVRSTIRYRQGEFAPRLIDDAIQDSLGTLMGACPQLTAAEPGKRLNLAIDMVGETTTKLLHSGRPAEGRRPGRKEIGKDTGKTTAADLSQQLSSQEIDAWLSSLPPRQRAAALFLYASDVTPNEVAAAIGESPGAIARQSAGGKADLMSVFRVERAEASAAAPSGPALQYREAGQSLAALMQPPTTAPAAAPPAADVPDKAAPAAEASRPEAASPRGSLAALASSMRVTGISSDLYSGWSLIATIAHLPRGQRIGVAEPFLLQPDAAKNKRMIVVDVAEIGNPEAEPRRFLLKAYAIDADKDGAGWRDGFHLGAAAVDNAEAKKTLANASLSSIEVARCLWHDYGTGPDPGLCR